MARYGQAMQDGLPGRLLPPERAVIDEVSREVGISLGTLERWRAAAARLQAVIVTAAMDEAQCSAWCREHGLYPSELACRRDEATQALADPGEVGNGQPKCAPTSSPSRNWNGTSRATRKPSWKQPPCVSCQESSRRSSTGPRTNDPAGRSRQSLMAQIEAACKPGARLAPACVLAVIGARTYQRWQADADRRADARPLAERPSPTHALSEAERDAILAVANEPRSSELPPARIVPALADDGSCIASESSFHRVPRAHHPALHRGRAHAPTAAPKPHTTHAPTRQHQAWCRDVSCLPAAVLGQWFFRYLVLDLYSRKVVGFTVETTDRSDHATHLLRRTALAEELFRTAKYRLAFAAGGFGILEEARLWANDFVRWHTTEHLYSGIRYVTPVQRHDGHDQAVLAARQQLYQAARNVDPARWSGPTRNRTAVGSVTINPDRKSATRASSSRTQSMPMAA